MALTFGLVFLLASSLLFIIAGFVYFHISNLSLPISSAVAILVALLPVGALFNTFIYPALLQSAQSSTNRFRQLTPATLQVLQAIATTILATLLFQDIVPSSTLECLLDKEWLRMFRAHDGESIRRIQDAFNCCGLNTVKDMPYPFPKTGPSSCGDTYGRTVGCRGPWRAALQSTAGVDFAVVVAVGLMQIFGLLMTRERPNWWASWRSTTRRQGFHVDARENRPLLTAAVDEEEEEEIVERQEPNQRGYQALGNNEDGGPRVQPSAIGQESNAWSEH